MVQNDIAHEENLDFGPNVLTDRHVDLQLFYYQLECNSCSRDT